VALLVEYANMYGGDMDDALQDNAEESAHADGHRMEE